MNLTASSSINGTNASMPDRDTSEPNWKFAKYSAVSVLFAYILVLLLVAVRALIRRCALPTHRKPRQTSCSPGIVNPPLRLVKVDETAHGPSDFVTTNKLVCTPNSHMATYLATQTDKTEYREILTERQSPKNNERVVSNNRIQQRKKQITLDLRSDEPDTTMSTIRPVPYSPPARAAPPRGTCAQCTATTHRPTATSPQRPISAANKSTGTSKVASPKYMSTSLRPRSNGYTSGIPLERGTREYETRVTKQYVFTL